MSDDIGFRGVDQVNRLLEAARNGELGPLEANTTPLQTPHSYTHNTSPYPQTRPPPGMAEEAAMGAAQVAAGGGIASSIVGAIGQMGSAAISGSAARYGADQQREQFKYYADKQFEGTKYTTDTAYKMWDRDYKIANEMGLYHPSQLQAVGGGGGSSGGEMIRLSGRGLSRVQRTKGRSIFG